MFAERPEWIVPQFVVKAIRYPGNQIHASEYVDTEDFSGPLRKVFDDAQAFIMRNLHKVQAGRGVNAPGLPEISESVFEELLVNALVHRDYLVSAPIRLFIFDNRIEIRGKILTLIQESSEITIPELAKQLDVSTRTIERGIASLRTEGVLRRIGPDKDG